MEKGRRFLFPLAAYGYKMFFQSSGAGSLPGFILTVVLEMGVVIHHIRH